MLEEILNCNTLIDKIILIKSCNDIYIFKVNKYKIEENITEITGETKKRSLFLIILLALSCILYNHNYLI